jgi:hypothetical protein
VWGAQKVSAGKPDQERGHLEGPSIIGRIILNGVLKETEWYDNIRMNIKGTGWDSLVLVTLDQWQAAVNAAVIGFQKRRAFNWLAEQL